jgi:phage portal protein BeeE
MNILARLRSTLAAFLEKKSGIAPGDWLRAADIETDGGAELRSPYSQSAWIYIAVSVLAETVAQVPFRIARIPRNAGKLLSGPRYQVSGQKMLRRILGENLVESGPVVELFDNPHPTMDRALFWETVMTWRALRGEFFILPLDKNDQPVGLPNLQLSTFNLQPGPVRRMITLSPDLFWHIVTGYELQGWRYTGSPLMSPLASQILLPGEVIHSRAPNPYQFWRGMSPLSVALLPAMSDFAAAQFMKGLMTNNADCGLIVTTKDQLAADQQLAVKAALQERKRKAGTADRPLFLFGDVSIQKPPVSSADLQFLENRKLNRQEIGAIFKVPESLMGFSDSKHSIGGASSIEQERMAFIENTIAAHCRRLEAAVQPIVRSFGPDLIGYFDLDCLPLLQQARRERLQAASQAFAMGVPFNEINAVYDLGFRSLPWGDTGHLPAKLQEAGQLSTEDSPSPAEEEASATENPFEKLANMIEPLSGSSRHQEALTFPQKISEPPDVGCYEAKEGDPQSIPGSEARGMVGTRSTASVTSPELFGRGGTRPYHPLRIPQSHEALEQAHAAMQRALQSSNTHNSSLIE